MICDVRTDSCFCVIIKKINKNIKIKIMENKKTGIIIAIVAIILFVGVAFIFMYEPKEQIVELTDVQKKYETLQNQFAMNLPCGITDFDSPYVTPVECDVDKMESGEAREIAFSVNVADEDGNGLENVKVSVNNGVPFFTDALGFLDMKIEVDSNKKVINLVVDKKGYSPIRRVLNAEVIDGNNILIPETFKANVVMRETEVQNAALASEQDTVIISDKYPGLSVTIPAGGLVNLKGETVTGEVVGAISYLDPENPEDRLFTPGVAGNEKMMVGVDHNGDQVLIESTGMAFFHIKEKDTDAILQPRKGVSVTITMPIPDYAYKNMTDPEAVAAAQISEEELREWIELYESFGVTEGMDEDERHKLLLENDQIAVAYWHFNQRTGLWEEWPMRVFEIDLEKKVYIMEVPRFY